MSALGMSLTVMCTGLAEAVRKDEAPEVGGFDLSAGMFGPHVSDWLRSVAAELTPTTPPIDMVLLCPECGVQHIDAPEPIKMAPRGFEHQMTHVGASIIGELNPGRWKNPPHRSHLCHYCGHIWRPADVPTNGVAAVQTKGKSDSPIVNRRGPA